MKKKKQARPRKARLKQRNRRVRMIKFSLLILLIISAFIGAAVFSRSDRAKVQSIKISGNSLISADALKKVAVDGGASAVLGVIKKDNLILYPKKKLEEDITEKFKAVKKVEVEFKTANTLGINVVERKPSYLWCKSPVSVPKDCFFMDDTGYIFSEAPLFSGNAFFIYYGLLDSKDIVGKSYLSPDRLKSLKTLTESMKTLGAKPVGLISHSDDDYEMVLSQNAKILFNTKTDFLKTFGNLEAIVKEQERKTGKGTFFKNLEHIDLRFSSKAFFKTK